MPDARWAEDWKIGVCLWVERQGDVVLREPGAELLTAIGRLHSITKAAKECGVSYRQAWAIVQAINAAAGAPLVESAVGGIKGGGARLTPQGVFALDLYHQLRATVRTAAAGILHRLVAEGDETPCVHLAAAISLQDAVAQLLTDYALQQPATKVRAVFGASNELASHLLSGAQGDLFISGDPAHLDHLHQAGLIEAGTRRKLAVNTLAAIARGDNKLTGVRRLSNLTAAAVKHVALAEPASPLGHISRNLLVREHLYDALKPKIVEVDNARAVVTAVQSGAAEVGLAFASDAAAAGCRVLFQVPPAQAGVTYEAAVVRSGGRTAAAKGLLSFLTSDRATRTLRRWGLRVPHKPRRKTAKRSAPA